MAIAKLVQGGVDRLPEQSEYNAAQFTTDECIYLALADGKFKKYGHYIPVDKKADLPESALEDVMYYAKEENLLFKYDTVNSKWIQITVNASKSYAITVGETEGSIVITEKDSEGNVLSEETVTVVDMDALNTAINEGGMTYQLVGGTEAGSVKLVGYDRDGNQVSTMEVQVVTISEDGEVTAATFAKGVVETNASKEVTFWVGTKAEREALTETDESCVYIVTDDEDTTVYEDSANKVTELTEESTDEQYPSAKAVNDKIMSTYPNATTITLLAADWDTTALTQTIIINGILADETKQSISVSPYTGRDNITAISDAGILCISQAENSLTFEAESVPEVDVQFYIEWKAINWLATEAGDVE